MPQTLIRENMTFDHPVEFYDLSRKRSHSLFIYFTLFFTEKLLDWLQHLPWKLWDWQQQPAGKNRQNCLILLFWETAAVLLSVLFLELKSVVRTKKWKNMGIKRLKLSESEVIWCWTENNLLTVAGFSVCVFRLWCQHLYRNTLSCGSGSVLLWSWWEDWSPLPTGCLKSAAKMSVRPASFILSFITFFWQKVQVFKCICIFLSRIFKFNFYSTF